ncbi:hypothetical protein KL86DYS2_12692 [uncultured Dysgonomonas sp.]|uniref:Uncharacterized protein n=2 Tax=Bacteroidota TaxID=976 RepID=A0A654BK64_SPHMU|nr:hypothetical protein KL86DYS2_12692 [uncultured Dysgonomonas sp.]VXC80587.1 conserved hypothetical protein [Sphingobacterium multivorum]
MRKYVVAKKKQKSNYYTTPIIRWDHFPNDLNYYIQSFDI